MKKWVILSVFALLFFIPIVSKAIKVETVQANTSSCNFKITADKNIKKIYIYKKVSDDKYMLFYIATPLGVKEYEVTISPSRLSTASTTELKVVTIDEDDVRSSETVVAPVITPSPTSTPTPTPIPVTPTQIPSPVPTSTPTPVPTSTPTPTPVDPTSIKLNQSSLSLEVGKTSTLKPTITPKNVKTTLTWSTSNKNVATIDKTGKVTAKKAGSATISVKTSNGKSASCKVTVTNPKLTGGEAIAITAVSLACRAAPEATLRVEWPYTRLYNNRTKAYVDAREKYVKGKNLYGGDYASCDMGTAVAIRCSGVDKNFQYKTIPNIWTYLKGSKYWKRQSFTFNGTSVSKLKPGDVLINNHHIILYVGNAAVKKKYKNSNADLYEAGFSEARYDSYYPRLVNHTTRKGDNTYSVFRHVNADKKLYTLK